MNFRVAWDDDTAADIDEAWHIASGSERQRIYDAISVIDQTLRTEPARTGESRESELVRVFTCMPVTVHFRIDMRLQMVRVFIANVYRRKS